MQYNSRGEPIVAGKIHYNSSGKAIIESDPSVSIEEFPVVDEVIESLPIYNDPRVQEHRVAFIDSLYKNGTIDKFLKSAPAVFEPLHHLWFEHYYSKPVAKETTSPELLGDGSSDVA